MHHRKRISSAVTNHSLSLPSKNLNHKKLTFKKRKLSDVAIMTQQCRLIDYSNTGRSAILIMRAQCNYCIPILIHNTWKHKIAFELLRYYKHLHKSKASAKGCYPPDPFSSKVRRLQNLTDGRHLK